MTKALKLLPSGKVSAFLFLLFAAAQSFAVELTDLTTEITTSTSTLSETALQIGVVIIGVAVIVGAVMLFKRLAGRL
jgi:amino acid permease